MNFREYELYRSFGVNEIATSQPIQIFVFASFAPVFFLRHRRRRSVCRRLIPEENGPETAEEFGS